MIRLTQSSVTGLALAALIASSSACSNSGQADAPSVTMIVEGSNTLGADVAKPSRIIITPKEQWLDLQGYVVGEANHAALQTIADVGKPGFQNMSPGVYDVILEGKLRAADGASSPAAIRISGVRIVNGADTQIREVDLKPYINLDGKVLRDGESSHGGIAVGIPGTPLKTLTASDGSFRIAKVPAGFHNLEFSISGFNSGFIQSKDYRADEHLPAIALTRADVRLDSGVHYLGAAVTADSAQKIFLQLVAPGSMTSFRYGTSDDLSDRPWSKLQSSLEIDLPAGEHPEVFVQYSLDERQLSQVFAVAIPVVN